MVDNKADKPDVIRRGIYSVDYFSGSQVSIYIGDVFVDDATTIDYSIMQSRNPVYGYASTLFDDVTEGHVLVQGMFTINFKEAGYLWLILDRYRNMMKKKVGSNNSPFSKIDDPLSSNPDRFTSAATNRETIERIINNEGTVFERNKALQDIAYKISEADKFDLSEQAVKYRQDLVNAQAGREAEIAASLQGYSSNTRAGGGVGRAENQFEEFEDAIWGMTPKELDDNLDRRTDSPLLNPFDIYVTFGDFAGDNRANHTIERIRDVYILGKSKRIVIDGLPIQEQYVFLAKNLV